MKFTFNASPNLRQRQSTQNIMFELMLGLLVVFGGQLYYYATADYLGMEYVTRALLIMATAVVTGLVTEFAWCLLIKKDFKKFVQSSFPLITTIILAMMVPVNTNLYAIVIATVFALLFGKLIFGGFGNNIFNPAALGRAIVLASFTTAVVSMDAFSGATATTTIASQYNWLVTSSDAISAMFAQVGGLTQLFTGQYLGGIGETNTLLIMLVGAVLALRKVIDWKTPVVYVTTIFLITLGVAVFRGVPGIEGFGILWYPLTHIATGGLMFGAVFMMTDPVTSPTSSAGRIVFAVGAAIITVLIRLLGNYPEGVLFAILLMNMLTPMIERSFDGNLNRNAKKVYITTAVLFLLGMGTTLAGANGVTPGTAPEPEPEPVTTLNFDNVKDINAAFENVADNGDGTSTFTVKAEGFYPDMNTFEIVLNTSTKEIVSIKVTNFVDTVDIGDVILTEEFLGQFTGKTADDSLEIDTASGATYSSQSVVRAVLEAVNNIGN
ncbi:MAG: RnfABCDGE type electron transport complex subunit D [Erysipelotrichaceae bacterium]